MRPLSLLPLGLALVLASACQPEHAAALAPRPLTASAHDVWTQHNDNARTGAMLNETTLTTSNVNVASFGKLFARDVDDEIYAQPLYLAGVPIGGAARNVVYVATVNDSLYAFDADDTTASAPLIHRSLLEVAPAGARPPIAGEVGQGCGQYQDFSGNMGIVGTPVIDVAAGTMYVVARTREGDAFVQRLHAVDVATLADRVPPQVITAQAPGFGAGTDGAGNIPFIPQIQNQRAALLLVGGVVYVAWASHCDSGPYHGWVVGYSGSTLQRVFTWNASPDGNEVGIWQSGEGPAADADGKIYLLTGNGTASAHLGGTSFGNSFVKLDPTKGPTDAVVDWFMPFNTDALNGNDVDLGSGGALLVPGTNLVVGGGKQGRIYLLDRANMGHFHDGDDSQIVQSLDGAADQIMGSPVTWSSAIGTSVYLWAQNDGLKQFALAAGRLGATPAAISGPQSAAPGGMLAVSANGNSDGSAIVWASHSFAGDASLHTRAGILRAFDARDVSKELWNSQQNAARDDFGNFAKFVPPTIANGHVYLATFSNHLAVYGLLGVPPPDAAPVMPDAAPVVPDAAPVMPDVAPVMPDAAPAMPDVAAPAPDAAVIAPPDVAVIADAAGPDAGAAHVPPIDAPVSPPDAAPAPEDGPAPLDAGAPEAVTEIPVDAETVSAADARLADSAPAAPAGTGCSCGVASGARGSPSFAGLVVVAVAGLRWRRRRRRLTRAL